MRGRALGLGALIALGMAAPASAARLEVSMGRGVGFATTYAYADDGSGTTLTITRAGRVVAQDSGAGRYGGASFVGVEVAAGDQVTVENPPGTVRFSAPFDGRPTINPDACIGSQVFTGKRSSADTAVTSVFSFDRQTDSYAASSVDRGEVVVAGEDYGVRLGRPLGGGSSVRVTTDRVLPGNVLVKSTLRQDVLACGPVATPPVLAVPISATPLRDRRAPTGRLSVSTKRALRALLGKRFVSKVRISEPGRVTQALYLVTKAKTPKYVKIAKTKRAKPVLLARGSRTAKRAGTVKVRLTPTTSGRKRLKRAKRVKVVLVTTLTDKAGNRRALPRKTFTAKR